MATTRKKTENHEEEVVEVVETVVAPPPLPPAPARKYTFEQWANIKKVPEHHKPGMRAFVKQLFPRSLEAWDAAFKTY